MNTASPNARIRGFTLIELLVVISIIGMLSSVVLVSLQGARDKGRIGAGISFDSSTYHAFGADAVFRYDFNSGSSQLDLIDVSGSGNNATCGSGQFTFNSDTPNNASGRSAGFSGAYVCSFSVSASKTISSLADKGSMSFWVNPNSAMSSVGIGNAAAAIFSFPNTTSYGVVSLCAANGGVTVVLRTGASCSSQAIIGTEVIPYGKWSHVFISWDNNATAKTVIMINGRSSFVTNPDVRPVFAWTTGTAFFFSYLGSTNVVIDNLTLFTQSIQNP